MKLYILMNIIIPSVAALLGIEIFIMKEIMSVRPCKYVPRADSLTLGDTVEAK